ncbi:MAG: Ig-like domain-containing protein [Elusimicrobiota bacterium]
MKLLKVFITTAVFLITAGYAMAYPDLYLNNTDIEFSNSYPEGNEVITITATIHNSGNSYSSSYMEFIAPVISYAAVWNGKFVGQSFHPAEDLFLTGIALMITDLGTDDTLTVNIQTDDPAGGTHKPTGVCIATETVNLDGEGASGLIWADIMFTTPTALSANTTYWIVAENYNVDTSTNGYGWTTDLQGGYAKGLREYSGDQGVSWNTSAYDQAFKIYNSTMVEVAFYEGDPDSGGTFISTQTIIPVTNGGTQIVSSTWSASTHGYIDVYVKIDPNNYLIESSTINNKAYSNIHWDCPRLVSALTIDDDLNGKIDAYRLVFNEDIEDSVWNKIGLDVAGRSNEVFYSTGLPNHPDTADDTDIYLSFNEGGAYDSDIKPQVLYSSTTGDLADVDDFTKLLDIATTTITETDGASPIVYSATASDDSGGGPGIQAGDKIKLYFSESVDNPPAITAGNIDSVLKSTFTVSTWTWTDGNGFIGAAEWTSANTILTITLSAGGGVPTVSTLFEILTDTFSFKDTAGNVSSHTVVIGGGFGIDTTSPTIISRETGDLDSDGYIDVVYIVFSENIDDSSVAISSFDVVGVTGESFSSTTNGDTADDSGIYITFNDGVLTTDKTPNLNCLEGAVKDPSGNSLLAISAPCADNSPPKILTALASDQDILIPGVDSDDRVVITFSEATNKPQIDASNIDNVLVLSNSHTWKDGSASWNTAGDILTVMFGSQASEATVSTGDWITISSTTVQVKDSLGNISLSSCVISGVFTGSDTTAPGVYSISPLNGSSGIPVDTSIAITFNERMDISKTTGAITITAVQDNNGYNINQQSAVAGFTESYNTADYRHKFTFALSVGLNNNYKYRVGIGAAAADTIGNSIQAVNYSFTTILDPAESNKVSSSDGKIKAVFQPGSLDEGFYVSFSTDPLSNSAKSPKIVDANNKTYLDDDPFTFPLNESLVDIIAYDAVGNQINKDFVIPVEITLSYSDTDNNGEVDNASMALPEEVLEIYWLDEQNNLWVNLTGSSVDTQNNKVSASAYHFTIFSIIGSGKTDLKDAYAFPVPFMPSETEKITFTNLSPVCIIKIYSMNGELIKKMEHSGGGQECWEDIEAGSGVYLYIIENDDELKKGKLMIIR